VYVFFFFSIVKGVFLSSNKKIITGLRKYRYVNEMKMIWEKSTTTKTTIVEKSFSETYIDGR
jgi:hypothetical protein